MSLYVSEADARRLLVGMGMEKAESWEASRLQLKLNKIPELVAAASAEPEESLLPLLNRIADAVAEGVKVKVGEKPLRDDTQEKPATVPGPKASTNGKPKEKKYDRITSTLRIKDEEAGEFTIAELKDFIGWEEEGDEKFGSEFTLRDVNKKKIRLRNNSKNRPFRIGLAKRWMLEIIRNKWDFNGESMVADAMGDVQDGQHRAVGAIMASQLLAKDPEHWKHYGWKGKSIPALVVTGITTKGSVADTLNLGLKRSLGDVVYRRDEFRGSSKTQKNLSNILAVATRLGWLRLGGKQVSDAKHFPHSEAIDFLKQHPRLREAVEFISTENGGNGDDGKKISSFISLGYASALLYLMATSKTERGEFEEGGTKALNFDLWQKACDFWVVFANGADLKKGDAILTLRNLLAKREAGSGKGRDAIIGLVIKAWNAWSKGESADAATLKVKKEEKPVIGGLDTEPQAAVAA